MPDDSIVQETKYNNTLSEAEIYGHSMVKTCESTGPSIHQSGNSLYMGGMKYGNKKLK
jgi:hypothetical protein